MTSTQYVLYYHGISIRLGVKSAEEAIKRAQEACNENKVYVTLCYLKKNEMNHEIASIIKVFKPQKENAQEVVKTSKNLNKEPTFEIATKSEEVNNPPSFKSLIDLIDMVEEDVACIACERIIPRDTMNGSICASCVSKQKPSVVRE